MPKRFGDTHRTYAASHPWITFTFDLHRLAEIDFIHLGEALSNCDHIAGVQLPPDVARNLHQVFLVKGIHATTQIEGNTLSEDEVRARVEGDLKLPESQEYLGKEIDNVLAACNLVGEELAAGRDMRLTSERIKQFNRMVLDGLPEEDDVVPGQIRTRGVEVGAVYRGAPAEDCELLLDELCVWLEQLTEDAGPVWARSIGLIRAILAHLYLAWIHPFGDGNGRTARLMEFQLLLEAGFPSPACHLMSNYYNRTRTRYYQALRETSHAEPYPAWKFVSYAVQGFVEELREQLALIQSHQLGAAWINFVHGADLGRSHPTARRRRALILALPGNVGEWTPISALTRLTPDLAAFYAGTTRKMLTRDVNCLRDAGLLVRDGSAVRPALEQMFAFLPLRKPPTVKDTEKELLDSLAAASVPNSRQFRLPESRLTTMSLIFATQLTAVATAVLAAFAIVTAFYARQAFRKQSQEVSDQASVLALQAAELRESLAERKREAVERRNAQASQVHIALKVVAKSREGGPEIEATIVNASERQQPVYDVKLYWHLGPDSCGAPNPELLGTLLTSRDESRRREFPRGADPAACGAALSFRDAFGVNWVKTPDGGAMHADSDLLPDFAKALSGTSRNGDSPPHMVPDVG